MEFYERYTESADMPFNKRLDKKEYYNQFKNNYEDFKKDWFSQRIFTTWLKKTSIFLGHEYNQDSTNGFQWFEVLNKDVELVEEDVEF